jgi:DNA-binding IclR family transcriptional regulator
MQQVSETPKYRAPALDKGLDILELLSRTPGSLNMTEIASGVGYSKGEIFRMLQVLEERNYIARSDNDVGYTLTNRLFMLGMERPQNKGLVEAALPVMHRLADETSYPCHLAVASREQIVVIARVDAPSDLGFVVRIGHRRPIAHSTSGVVLFAFQSDEAQARWLSILDAKDVGYRRKNFIGRAAVVRDQGYANFPSEVVEGVKDLSAPILQQGNAIGALTIPYIDRHPSTMKVDKVIKFLCDAVADISTALTAY